MSSVCHRNKPFVGFYFSVANISFPVALCSNDPLSVSFSSHSAASVNTFCFHLFTPEAHSSSFHRLLLLLLLLNCSLLFPLPLSPNCHVSLHFQAVPRLPLSFAAAWAPRTSLASGPISTAAANEPV